MIHLTKGKIRFFSQVELSPRWTEILCFTAKKIWERVCKDFGDLPAEKVIILVHAKPITATVRIREGNPLILIGLPFIARIGAKEIKDGNPRERLFRAFRVILDEELVHLHGIYSGEPVESNLEDEDSISHYARGCEYRALRHAVGVAGQRKGLLAKVEEARTKTGS